MDKNKFKIGEFAKLSGISRNNLLFYDQRGLLSPVMRDCNGYRYYDKAQLNHAYMITIFRSLGISIDEIKHFYNYQSPNLLKILFHNKQVTIEQRIQELTTILDVMKIYSAMITDAEDDNINSVSIKSLSTQKLFTGPVLNDQLAFDYDTANLAFYKFCNRQGLSLIFPFGIKIAKQQIIQNKFNQLKQCYFMVPTNSNDERDAGKYAVGYYQENYNDIESVVSPVLRYIQSHRLIIDGDAYIDYPYNETS